MRLLLGMHSEHPPRAVLDKKIAEGTRISIGFLSTHSPNTFRTCCWCNTWATWSFNFNFSLNRFYFIRNKQTIMYLKCTRWNFTSRRYSRCLKFTISSADDRFQFPSPVACRVHKKYIARILCRRRIIWNERIIDEL